MSSGARSGSTTSSALSGPVSVCVDRPVLSLDRPFTYDLAPELDAGVGHLVEVPFHGRRTRGWVLGPTQDVPGRILPVKARVSHVSFFDRRMLELALYLRERYVAPLASVLKRLSPPRVVAEERAAGLGSPERTLEALAGGGSDLLAGYRDGPALAEAIGEGTGVWSLRPAPEEEVAIALECVRRSLVAGRRVIVVVPEAVPVPATATAISETFGERVALFLGGAKRTRYRTWLDVRDGRYDVVVGTRPAAFSPLEGLGLIYISREGHAAHREDRSPYFHVRDVAIARARIEGASCVLAALFPSVETAAAGARTVAPTRRRWPPVEVVRPGPEGRAPRLVSALRQTRRAFLYEPQPGYGIAQICRSCGEAATCAACGGPLRAQEGSIRCTVCGADGSCGFCGSANFGLRRGGVERVREWAARVAAVPVRGASHGRVSFDRDGVTVAGPEVVRDVGPAGLDLVGILHADAARLPGLSAAERVLSTWAEAVAWARPDGRAIVQSSEPNDDAVQSLVQGNPDRFHRAEIGRRREAGFPVGSPVFRVAGTSALPSELRALHPITLLTSGVGDETLCLLSVAPERSAAFGAAARDLAARGLVTRVEAEPHL
jgi:primosomal protein N' (replication factor Y) (superfamily II helicase)